jgi:hypothetical protein
LIDSRRNPLVVPKVTVDADAATTTDTIVKVETTVVNPSLIMVLNVMQLWVRLIIS